MKKHGLITAAITIACLGGCSTASQKGNSPLHPDIQMADVERLKPGNTSALQLQTMLPAPDLKVPDPDNPDIEGWVYFNASSRAVAKLTLRIRLSSGILEEVVWGVDPTESVSVLSAAKSHFNDAQFVAHERISVSPNGHTIQSDTLYTDPRQGLELICENRSEKVGVIVWSIPRQPIANQ
jgi:hypothetical protein